MDTEKNDIINGINQSYDFDKSNKNINAGNTINSRTYSSEFLSKCETLKDYMTFVNKVRVKTDIEKIDIRTAVIEAVDECIAENVLSEFFRNHREEVITVSIYEYDEEGYYKDPDATEEIPTEAEASTEEAPVEETSADETSFEE